MAKARDGCHVARHGNDDHRYTILRDVAKDVMEQYQRQLRHFVHRTGSTAKLILLEGCMKGGSPCVRRPG